MPRCQRTFRRLPETEPARRKAPVAAAMDGRQWVCPHCEDGETYRALADPDLLQYARLAEDAACADFGRPGDTQRPTLLILGLRPECVLEPDDRRYDVYLQRGSDPLQLRLQIGHEVFHRVCSLGRIFHWTHEMLACVSSVRLLQRQGFAEYAAQMARQYRADAEGFPAAGLFAADLWTMPVYPEGYYGRAFVTGRALEKAAGWPALCRLARAKVSTDGAPDVAAWLAGLPADARERARAVLAGASESSSAKQGAGKWP